MNDTNDDGFTMVEVIVALALFVLVAGSATFAIISSVRASTATDTRVAAGFVAQQELDRIRLLGPTPSVPNRPSATRSVTTDGRQYTVSVSANPAWSQSCATGAGYRDVTVSVSVVGGRNSPIYLDSRLACDGSTP